MFKTRWQVEIKLFYIHIKIRKVIFLTAWADLEASENRSHPHPIEINPRTPSSFPGKNFRTRASNCIYIKVDCQLPCSITNARKLLCILPSYMAYPLCKYSCLRTCVNIQIWQVFKCSFFVYGTIPPSAISSFLSIIKLW